MDAKIIVLGQMDNGDGTFEMQNRVYSQYGISPTLNTFGGGHRQPKILCGEVNYPVGEYSADQHKR